MPNPSPLGVSTKSALGAFESAMRLGGYGMKYNPKKVDAGINPGSFYVVRAARVLNRVWEGQAIPEKALLGCTFLLHKLGQHGCDVTLEFAMRDMQIEFADKTLSEIWQDITVEKNHVGNDAMAHIQPYYTFQAKIRGK